MPTPLGPLITTTTGGAEGTVGVSQSVTPSRSSTARIAAVASETSPSALAAAEKRAARAASRAAGGGTRGVSEREESAEEEDAESPGTRSLPARRARWGTAEGSLEKAWRRPGTGSRTSPRSRARARYRVTRPGTSFGNNKASSRMKRDSARGAVVRANAPDVKT